MKERAFNATQDEVRHMLTSETGQVWRPVEPQPPMDGYVDARSHCGSEVCFCSSSGGVIQEPWRSPFGVPGDRLWVRETWTYHPDADEGTLYRATDPGWDDANTGLRWRSSATMPKWASRITLEVTGVRAVQVQEHSVEDAIAAGCVVAIAPGVAFGPLGVFRRRWNSRYAKRGLGWDKNPWAWASVYQIRYCSRLDHYRTLDAEYRRVDL